MEIWNIFEKGLEKSFHVLVYYLWFKIFIYTLLDINQEFNLFILEGYFFPMYLAILSNDSYLFVPSTYWFH